MVVRNILSVLILLAAAVAVHTQSARKVIFWNGDKACGFKSKAVTPEDVVRCDSILTERGPVSTISINGVGLAVAFLEDDPYNIVSAHITNRTGEAVSFDSDLWGAAHFKTKAGYYAGEKPIVAETSMPSRDILRRLSKDVKLESSLDTFIADHRTTMETKEIRYPDGTRYRVNVIVPDKEAQQSAVRQNTARGEMVTNEQRRIRSTALTAKSVPAEGYVKGLVYFRRVNNADFIVFSISVDGTSFVFLLPRNKK